MVQDMILRFFARTGQRPLVATVVDTIDDTMWALLDNDEQRLLYAIERRQLRRSSSEQFQRELDGWRRSITLREKLRGEAT